MLRSFVAGLGFVAVLGGCSNAGTTTTSPLTAPSVPATTTSTVDLSPSTPGKATSTTTASTTTTTVVTTTTVAATTTATTTTTEPIYGWVLRGDGLGSVSFGDTMDTVTATLSDLFGPPSDDYVAEAPFEDSGAGDRGPFACNTRTGFVCFDYLRIVSWDTVGIDLVFADFKVNAGADPIDADYYLQVPTNLRGYIYGDADLGSALATAEGLTIGATVDDVHDLYGDAVRFGLDCGEVTTYFFLDDEAIGGTLLGNDAETFTESGFVNPDATVGSIYAGMAHGSC